MPVNMHGQLAIQATAPGEDPIKVGSLWVDTSGTATLKVCTSISPYTFSEISGTDTGITELTGDVTAGPGDGSQAATIANGAVTLAKMADLAQDRLIGRQTASTGVPEAITCTAAGRNLLDDATAAAQATTLGLGTGDSPQFTALTLSNGQLVFPATQVASAGANTLDDYEEGTWTPVIGGTSSQSGQSYTRQIGRYIKIGKLVFVNFSVTLSAKGTIAGNIEIQGLPFTSANVANNYGASPIRWLNLNTNVIWVQGQVDPNDTVIAVLVNTAAATSLNTNITTTDLTDTTWFIGSAVYEAAS